MEGALMEGALIEGALMEDASDASTGNTALTGNCRKVTVVALG